MTRVLLVEDDQSIADPLCRALRREGYDVQLSGTGGDALADFDREPADLVVLDLGLPDIDGLEVCRELRTRGNGVPVLVLTARADEVDTVVGLDAGADDYVAKPFRLAELLARVRALLRRSAEPAGEAEGGPDRVRLDTEGRRVWVGDREVHLAAKEFELLRVLFTNAGKVVSREDLMTQVWSSEWWKTTKTLDMHVSWLRRKLGDDATDPKFITTVRGMGFRFDNGS